MTFELTRNLPAMEAGKKDDMRGEDVYGEEDDLSWLPERPEEPLPSECCGSGCEPCVLDVYQDQLAAWRTLQSMSPRQRARWRLEQQKEERDAVSSKPLQPALSHSEYCSFTVTAVARLTPDTLLFTFALPQPDHTLNLRVGQHILLRVGGGDGHGSSIVRQYTPVSPLNHTGSFQVAIKLYADGGMSEQVRQWSVGSTAQWRGPFGNLPYSANMYTHVGLLACGTGIAPMVQVIRAIVENDMENTFVRLVYACRSQHDIILKRELLDSWISHWNLSVLYVLSRASEESMAEDGGSIRYGDRVHFGRVDGELVKREMPPSESGRSFVMVCGTRSFVSDMKSHLEPAGYSQDKIYVF